MITFPLIQVHHKPVFLPPSTEERAKQELFTKIVRVGHALPPSAVLSTHAVPASSEGRTTQAHGKFLKTP